VLEFETNRSAPFAQVLDEMRATGYEGTELGDWGFMPTRPADLARELARRDLQLVGAFVPIAFARRETHDAGVEAALRTARLLREANASDALVVLSDDNAAIPLRESRAGRIRDEDGLSMRDWATFVEGVTRVAGAVRDETGLRSVFHPHGGGYVETVPEIDALMSRTDPSLLGLCLDTGHIMYGGGDPLDVLERHAGRVWHVHFKDYDSTVASDARRRELGYLATVRAQVFCELGAGAVDFAAIVAALRRHQYGGWIVVEQDVFPGQGTPVESARRNRQFLRSIGI